MKTISARYSKLFTKSAVLVESLALVAGIGAFSLTPLVANAGSGTPATVTVDTISDPIGGTHTSPFNFSCASNPLYNPVSLTGSGQLGSNPAGQITAYFIQVDWGDGTIVNGIAPSLNADANNTFTFSAGPHSYTSATTTSIKVRIYHQNPPGNDNQADSSFTVQTCIYVPPTNTGALLVTKTVVGGNKTPSDFTLNVTNSSSTPSSFHPTTGTTTVTLTPGNYSIGETSDSEYTPTYSSDCSGSIAAGETRVCHVTNTFVAPTTHTLTYTAGANGSITGTSPQTVNDGASGMEVTAVPDSGFSFSGWSDGSTTPSRTDSDVTSDMSVTANFSAIPPVTHTLTYTAGAGGSITGTSPQTVNDGASGTEVTAVANSGFHFVDWSDGSTTPSRTDTNVTANVSVTASFEANPIVTHTLTYTAGLNGSITGSTTQVVNDGADGTEVTAIPDLGFHFVDWSDGSTTASRTDTDVTTDISVTADFASNPPTIGTLTVIKDVTNDNGGSAVAGDFTIHVKSGETDVEGSPAVGSTIGTVYTLAGGDYVVSEDATSTYSSDLSQCGDGGSVTVINGENTTCTITNDDIAPQLTVIKHVVNDNGGSAVASDFTMNVDGTNVSSTTFAGAEDPGTTVTLDAGSYSVSETGGPDGYGSTLGTDCSGTIGLGESKTCTVTNDDGAAQLTIVKHVVGGMDSTFGFSVDGTSDTVFSATSSITTHGGVGTTTLALNAGTYDVTEDVPAGWHLSNVDCQYEGSIGTSVQNGEFINVNPGADITCTFTDTATVADLSVTKSVDNASPLAGDTITYTLTASNAGPGDASGVSVSDLLPTGVSYVSDDGAGAYDSSSGVWAIGSLPAASSTTLHITATVASDATAGEEITNTADIFLPEESNVSDDTQANNESSTTITVAQTPTTPTPTVTHHGGGGGGGGCSTGFSWSPTAGKCVPIGQVLGAATSTPQLGVTCGVYMNQHLRMGSPKNNSGQVTRLQQFLNKHGYGTFAPTGYFGPLTFAAVKAFQQAYASTILTPWNIQAPTGLAYLTTLRQLNLIECPDLMLPMPELVPWNQNPNAQ